MKKDEQKEQVMNAQEEIEIVDLPEQTRFAEEAVIFSDVPKVGSPIPLEASPKRPPYLLLIPVGVLFILALLFVAALFSRRQESSLIQFDRPSEASASSRIRPEIERRLRLVETDVAESDPIEPQLAFPPISFELDLQDATTRQNTQRRF